MSYLRKQSHDSAQVLAVHASVMKCQALSCFLVTRRVDQSSVQTDRSKDIGTGNIQLQVAIFNADTWLINSNGISQH